MGKRDDLIQKYASDLKDKCGVTPDMDLLTKVTIGCGPSIYDADASTIAASQASELETVKEKFLMKTHGVTDEAAADKAIQEVCEQYKGARNKMRVVFYYILTKKLGLEKAYA